MAKTQNIAFILILILFTCLGIIFDKFFAQFKTLIIPLLIVIMLNMGITLNFNDFKEVLKKPYLIAYGALLQFTIMPLMGFLIPYFTGFNPEIKAGFVLVGSAPGGTASNLMTFLALGSLPYSISMTALSTLLSPLLTPFWTYVLAGRYVPVPFLKMTITTFKIVIIPVLLGMIINYVLSDRINKIKKIIPPVTVLTIAFIIGIIFAINKKEVLTSTLPLLVMVTLHTSAGFILGFVMGKITKLPLSMKKALSIEVGMQNSGLSATLAMKFISPLSALPSAIFSIVQNIIGLSLAMWWRRKN